MAKIDELTTLLRPAAEALGYEFLGIEYISQGKHSVLRIYIDHEQGITVDDCAAVSHQASGILEVEDPIANQYTLEVSSPGLDRPLFTENHYLRFLGEEAQVRCRRGVAGRRNFKGVITACENGLVTLNVDGEDYQLDIGDIEKANLVAKFD